MSLMTIMIDLLVRDHGSRQMNDFAKASSRAGASVSELAQKSAHAKGSFVNLAGAFTGLMVAGKAFDVLKGVMKPTLDLETGMKRMAILTNASTQQLAAYRAKAFEVAKLTPFTPVEAMEGMVKLRQTTGSAESAMQALIGTAGVATMSFGDMDLKDTANMMGELGRTFGMTGAQLGKAGAMIWTASKQGAVGLEMFKDVMGRLGMGAMRGGDNFEGMGGFQEVLTLFTLAKRSISTPTEASNTIVRLLGEMQKGKASKLFEGVGIDLEESPGKMKKISDILLEMTARFDKLQGVGMRDTLNEAIGERSVKGLLAMLRALKEGVGDEKLKGKSVFDFFKKAFGGSEKEMLDDLNRQLQGTKTALELLGDAFEALKITIGESISGPIKTLAEAGKAIFEWIADHKDLFAPFIRAAAISTALWALAAAWQGLGRILSVVNLNLIMSNFAAKAAAATTAGAATTNMFSNMTSTANAMPAAAAKVNKFTTALKGMGLAALSLAKHLAIFAAIAEVIKAIGVATDSATNPIDVMGNRKYTAMEAIRRQNTKEMFERIGVGSDDSGMMMERYWKKYGGQGLSMGSAMDKMQEMTKGWAAEKHFRTSLANISKGASEAAAKAAKAQNDAAEKLKDAFIVGSVRMGKLLDRIEGINKFEPPVVQWGVYKKLKSKLVSAGKGNALEPEDRIMVESALSGMPEIERLQEKSEKGVISGEDRLRLTDMQNTVGVLAKHIQVRYGGSLISKTLAEAFRTGVVGETAKQGTREAADWSGRLMELQSGDYWQRRGAVTGAFNEAQGGYKPLPSSRAAFRQKKPAGPQSSAYFSMPQNRSYDPAFAAQTGAANAAAAAAAAPESPSLLILPQRIDALGETIVRTLTGQTLKVRVTEVDKGAGGAGGGSPMSSSNFQWRSE